MSFAEDMGEISKIMQEMLEWNNIYNACKEKFYYAYNEISRTPDILYNSSIIQEIKENVEEKITILENRKTTLTNIKSYLNTVKKYVVEAKDYLKEAKAEFENSYKGAYQEKEAKEAFEQWDDGTVTYENNIKNATDSYTTEIQTVEELIEEGYRVLRLFTDNIRGSRSSGKF